MTRKIIIIAALLCLLLPFAALADGGEELPGPLSGTEGPIGSAPCAHDMCISLGREGHICLRCGAVAAHDIREKTIAATCMTVGYTETFCTACGHIADQYDIIEPSAKYHVWGSEMTEAAPTCFSEGTVSRECTLCGTKETMTIPMTEHTPVTYETAPDCMHDGMITVVCSVCGTEISTTAGEPRSALYHAWGEWATETEPGCETAGSEKRVCSICGAEHRRDTEPAGHTPETKVFEAAEGNDGYTVDICAVCGAETGERRDITHYPCEEPETVVPTCAKAGSITVKCVNCGEIISQDVLPPTGAHEWGRYTGRYTVESEPTCVTAGESMRKCSVCGLTERKYIAAAGHDIHEVTVEPSGLSVGYTVDRCSICGVETGVRRDVIPAKIDLSEMTKVGETCEAYTEGIKSVVVYELETDEGIVRAVCMEAENEALIDMSGVEADVVCITHGGLTLTICAPGAVTAQVSFFSVDAYCVRCVLTGVAGERGEYTAVCGDEGGAIYRGYVTLSTGDAGVTLRLIEEYPG